MALCQATGFLESLLRLVGLNWAVPDFGTLSRRQMTLKVNIPNCGSNGPLHLPGQEIASFTADGAFDTRKCHDAIAARGAAAIIPPRKNAKPWKPDTSGTIARNEILRTPKRVGRTIRRRWSGYHRRSRAETKLHCVMLLGQRLSARDFYRHFAEFQVCCCRFRGHEEKIVTKEPESGYDETEVQP